ncbi:hypothetical protein KR767_04095 [Luteibacter anthropi]|uniref:hypothetical protein n=1 Tax=Luteibacter anthropi TaxID=564369 RepID=UPI0020328C6C|nr:hypothetical protein [Luteibacter anthropi]URX63258.1 hypothetical protein KR767_04095 [Luteibacter anthropi]
MDITVDTSQITQLTTLWQQAPEIAGQEMLRAATEIDLLVQGELMQIMPRGVGGLHGAGLTGAVFREEHLLDQGVTGMVATSQQYAEYVEVGTKPHAPPIQPLKDWVEVKLGIRGEEATGVAFAISRSIAKRGTRAQPVWQQTYQRLLPTIQSKLDEGVARIRARLAGGAA